MYLYVFVLSFFIGILQKWSISKCERHRTHRCISALINVYTPATITELYILYILSNFIYFIIWCFGPAIHLAYETFSELGEVVHIWTSKEYFSGRRCLFSFAIFVPFVTRRPAKSFTGCACNSLPPLPRWRVWQWECDVSGEGISTVPVAMPASTFAFIMPNAPSQISLWPVWVWLLGAAVIKCDKNWYSPSRHSLPTRASCGTFTVSHCVCQTITIWQFIILSLYLSVSNKTTLSSLEQGGD